MTACNCSSYFLLESLTSSRTDAHELVNTETRKSRPGTHILHAMFADLRHTLVTTHDGCFLTIKHDKSEELYILLTVHPEAIVDFQTT
jgi:hypothetical protein